MSRRLDWDSDGEDWPQRETSRFVVANGLRWHVQVAGQGPVLLLLHGTGASTHSWRGLMPLLARRFTVVAPDLPGHAFTDPLPSHRLSLPGMAHAVGALSRALGLSPDVVLGHSAGAAVLLRMVLDGLIAPRTVVSMNGALLPFAGWAGLFFAPMARLMTMTPMVATLFARRARDVGAVARLVASTGSVLDAHGLALYQRLLSSPGHVAGALDMMARWDLAPLARDLPRLATPLQLLVAECDATVDPGEARRVTRAVVGATVTVLSRLGHLAHEEAPERVLEAVLAALRK
ncbi:MAG: alpha/beta fold hydrolase BchO [Betaproteobacteria bacterium]